MNPTRCRHGIPEGYVDDVGKDMLDAFLEEWFASTDNMNNGLTAMRKLSPVYHTVMEHPDAAQFFYGLAASYLRRENQDSFLLAPLDEKPFKTFRAAVLIDKCKFSVPMSEEEHIHEMTRLNWCFVKHAKSLRDVVMYIDKKIPCNCLAVLKQEILEHSEIRVCNNCKKDSLNPMWCEDCLAAEYCSKECQLASWPEHQPLCKFFSGKIAAGDLLAQIHDKMSTTGTDSNGNNKNNNTA
ncbi:expressed unknown protein [Seminavis robusta]|uniref:MYND-type domain-containing protein n=1 Tax=Seminavis robusta TaxID=568900 RepID=A0A9N8H1L1_9STRA|nr:expressed unknown protein [Seminavis robusta]|eukprot:Sro5_g004120.1 n/a (239) ;mRNA; r:61008-61724